jgi:predicted RNase H-like HicB family nuclease
MRKASPLEYRRAHPAGYNDAVVKRRKFEAHFIHRGKWWVAWTDDVPGALTQGKTIEEARGNLKDAVRLMLEPLEALPKTKSSSRHVCETLSL